MELGSVKLDYTAIEINDLLTKMKEEENKFPVSIIDWEAKEDNKNEN